MTNRGKTVYAVYVCHRQLTVNAQSPLNASCGNTLDTVDSGRGCSESVPSKAQQSRYSSTWPCTPALGGNWTAHLTVPYLHHKWHATCNSCGNQRQDVLRAEHQTNNRKHDAHRSILSGAFFAAYTVMVAPSCTKPNCLALYWDSMRSRVYPAQHVMDMDNNKNVKQCPSMADDEHAQADFLFLGLQQPAHHCQPAPMLCTQQMGP